MAPAHPAQATPGARASSSSWVWRLYVSTASRDRTTSQWAAASEVSNAMTRAAASAAAAGDVSKPGSIASSSAMNDTYAARTSAKDSSR